MQSCNELSFRRLQLVNDYVSHSKHLSTFLEEAQYGISKARSLHGITLTSIVQLDTHDMEPTARITIKDGVYSVEECSANDDEVKVKNRKEKAGTVEEVEDKVVKIPAFRPFGVLEPTAAKDARRNIASALTVICELASIQSEIRSIDDKLTNLKTALKLEHSSILIEALSI